ncbi:MAG TPA: hypothetical protein VGP47_07900 [Parachlamydiaceae bacterium]|nr:hypothetical protein [Parachlamydiaceae bacterium]
MFKTCFVGLPMLFASLFSFFGGSVDPYEKNEALMAKTVNTSIKQLSKRYGLTPAGRGGGIQDDKSKNEFIAFQLQRKLTKDEARILIVEITELLLYNINNTPEIRPYLYNDPFTYKNLELVVYLSNKDDSTIYDPELGLVALTRRGNVNFATYKPVALCIRATDIEEPYEETYKRATGKEYSEGH